MDNTTAVSHGLAGHPVTCDASALHPCQPRIHRTPAQGGNNASLIIIMAWCWLLCYADQAPATAQHHPGPDPTCLCQADGQQHTKPGDQVWCTVVAAAALGDEVLADTFGINTAIVLCFVQAAACCLQGWGPSGTRASGRHNTSGPTGEPGAAGGLLQHGRTSEPGTAWQHSCSGSWCGGRQQHQHWPAGE